MQAREYFLWVLFRRLREWHFPLALEDYQGLHDALNAGFGWDSRPALRSLCGSLWAKSRQEQEVLFTLFDRLVEEFGLDDWRLGPSTEPPPSRKATSDAPTNAAPDPETTSPEPPPRKPEPRPEDEAPRLQSGEETAGLSSSALLAELQDYSHAHLILSPRYVVSYRQVAQAWRRLRRFERQGPKTELDIQATIDLRCRTGVVAPLVLRPIRRNMVRLVLLVDRGGSMVPFHQFTDNAVCKAIDESGRFAQVSTFYFHDTPSARRGPQNTALLRQLSGRLFPPLAPVVGDIQRLRGGSLYKDPDLLEPLPLEQVLTRHAAGASVVIVSDAGAARGNHDTMRLLDTIAFLKTVYAHTRQLVWLNPLPPARWPGSSAAQLSRFVPMFPVDRDGLYQAVNVLRGHAHELEYPL